MKFVIFIKEFYLLGGILNGNVRLRRGFCDKYGRLLEIFVGLELYLWL